VATFFVFGKHQLEKCQKIRLALLDKVIINDNNTVKYLIILT